MMFSSSILFLGCWLTGHWWIVTGKVYPKPTIEVHPSSVVPSRRDFIIYCNGGGSLNESYYLYKQGNALWNPLKMLKLKNRTSGFYFNYYTKPPDGGIYKCAYCFCRSNLHSQLCSQDSNTIEVIVRDNSLLKPSIAISKVPVLNENATIECEGQENDLNFTLYRFSNQISVTETDTNRTKFSFSPLKVEDGGRYTCEYRRRRNPFVLSLASEPLELNLTDSSLSKPTIELRPVEGCALGRSVSIECRGPESGLNFSLQQPSSSAALWLSGSMENTTEFFLARVTLEDAGNYTCRYHHRDNPFVWSVPSEPVLLVVRAVSTVEASIRLVVAILVLLATLLIAAEAIYSSKTEAASMSPE